jgi:hypothetical protein
MNEHLILLLSGAGVNALAGLVVWLQVRAIRRESRLFWTGTAGTLIKVWRIIDPDGAAKVDREMK